MVEELVEKLKAGRLDKIHILLLDIDGPLGEVYKKWANNLRKFNVENEEDEAKRERLLEIYDNKLYTNREIYTEFAKLNNYFINKYEKLREKLWEIIIGNIGEHKEQLKKLFNHFTEIILYSNIPHGLTRHITNILTSFLDLESKKIRGIGRHPVYPYTYKIEKPRLTDLLPQLNKKDNKGTKVYVLHLSDKDVSLDEFARNHDLPFYESLESYTLNKGIDSVEKTVEALRKYINSSHN
jgi:hypothetical protein